MKGFRVLAAAEMSNTILIP